MYSGSRAHSNSGREHSPVTLTQGVGATSEAFKQSPASRANQYAHQVISKDERDKDSFKSGATGPSHNYGGRLERSPTGASAATKSPLIDYKQRSNNPTPAFPAAHTQNPSMERDEDEGIENGPPGRGQERVKPSSAIGGTRQPATNFNKTADYTSQLTEFLSNQDN